MSHVNESIIREEGKKKEGKKNVHSKYNRND